MQYFVLPAIVTATGLLASAAPVNKEETGIQPLAPPATRPGAPLVLQWNPDVSGSKEWKHMSISLVTVGKDGHEKTTKLVSNIDGTNPSKTNYTTEAPKHPKNSNVYFVEFSDGKTKKKSPQFTIENTDSSYHVRRHGHSETFGSDPNSALSSAESGHEEGTLEDSMDSSDPEALNSMVQDEANSNGQRMPTETLSQQGQAGRPLNIGGIMYVPLVPSGMLESLVHEAHAMPNTATGGFAEHPSISIDRNNLARFESEGQHLNSQGLDPTSSSSTGNATESVTASPKSSSHKHSTKSATPTATSTKPGHASASHVNLEGTMDSASATEKLGSLTASLASHSHTRTPLASATSASSDTGSHGSHGIDNVASQLFNVPAMKKRSEDNMDHIISRIATVNPQVSHAFAANTHGAGHGNLTNTASSSGNATASKHHAKSTGHRHGNATSTASASSSSAPTSASNSTSAKPTSASSHASGSSSAHELSSKLLSSLATMSSSQVPEALSSLGISQSASLFAGMDPLDGFRSSSHGAKTSSQPSSSSSSSSQPSSTSSSSSQPSSSASQPSSSSASTHHRGANATRAHDNSSSAAKPTSMSSGSMTRSRGSNTRTSGSQRHSSDTNDVLAQGILGDTGLSPSQISQYYGNHNSHSAHNSRSGHGSQSIQSHGQGRMSASLHYKHGHQSVSQSF